MVTVYTRETNSQRFYAYHHFSSCTFQCRYTASGSSNANLRRSTVPTRKSKVGQQNLAVYEPEHKC